MDESVSVTQALRNWSSGSSNAGDVLTPAIYKELKSLAAYYLRNEHAANTLQPTALVHEAYMKLALQKLPEWEGRSHFFGVAAHLMRQILVDHARRHRSEKRGDGIAPLPLNEALGFATSKSRDVIALDDALTALSVLDERKCRVIELRFFGGFSVEETADALGVSVATVGREQRLAEAWLHRQVSRCS